LDAHNAGASLRKSIQYSAADAIARVVSVAQFVGERTGQIPAELVFVLNSFENHTLGWWSLTMLSRIFYAASVAGTQGQVPAHEASNKHLRYCRHKRVCPACGGELTTVMGKEER
jgi:Zn finger protein HypA/HybF involved in hydrogenase expression